MVFVRKTMSFITEIKIAEAILQVWSLSF